MAVTGIGMALGTLPHLAVGRPARTAGMASRLLAVACAASPSARCGHRGIVRRWWAALAAMALLVTVASAGGCVMRSACIGAIRCESRLWVTFTDELRVQGLLGVAVGASAC